MGYWKVIVIMRILKSQFFMSVTMYHMQDTQVLHEHQVLLKGNYFGNA